MRYERKYRIEDFSFSQVKAAFLQHPMSFRTLFPDRWVNSIYLDTPRLELLRENLAGVGVRRKFRIRWYGEDRNLLTNPILEIKRKDGERGDKVLAQMEDFGVESFPRLADEISRQFKGLMLKATDQPLTLPQVEVNDRSLKALLPSLRPRKEVASTVPPKAFPGTQLSPVVVVSYLRSYFMSYDRHFRMTIDRQMEFRAVDGWGQPGQRQWVDNAVVVEVKYEADQDLNYDRVGQHIPFRLSKNSKYVNGMTLVGNV